MPATGRHARSHWDNRTYTINTTSLSILNYSNQCALKQSEYWLKIFCTSTPKHSECTSVQKLFPSCFFSFCEKQPTMWKFINIAKRHVNKFWVDREVPDFAEEHQITRQFWNLETNGMYKGSQRKFHQHLHQCQNKLTIKALYPFPSLVSLSTHIKHTVKIYRHYFSSQFHKALAFECNTKVDHWANWLAVQTILPSWMLFSKEVQF